MPSDALKYLDVHRDDAIKRLTQLLSIPSVSTDPAYRQGIDEASAWMGDQLEQLGFEVTIHRVDGPPIVTGHARPEIVADAQAPQVLFYGHYDVQPPDPLEQWETPAFEPTIREGAIYARGASDDKGQVCCFLEALRAWKESTGKLPGPVTVLIEGEEECGSVHLESFLAQKREKLTADVVVVSDTSMWESSPHAAPERSEGAGHQETSQAAAIPAITYALRGLLYYDIKLHGPSRDLHSGVYGGTLANPATILTRVLGGLFDENHRVTIPGFYDDVAPPDPREREQWVKLGFDEKAFLGEVGVDQPFGEADFDTLERRWIRPSCDVNGLYGGYEGAGAKTVIPAFAGAKVSFRLAAHQKAHTIAHAFERWLHDQQTHGCRWELTNHGEADPVAVPLDSPWVAAAQRAMQRVAGELPGPVLVREGATIPVVAWFKSILGLDSLLIGFGLNSDRIHSPNEHLGLDRFELGCRTHVSLLAEIAGIAD